MAIHQFTNILFSPLSRHQNPAAIRRLTELAAKSGAKLTLFGVVTEPSGLQRLFHRPGLVDEALEAERARLMGSLRRWATQAPAETAISIDVGDSSVRIAQRVLAGGHDLVVVSSDEDGEDRATIRRLLRQCPCPVWVIRPTRARTQRVLAAVNPDPGEAELNRAILGLAVSMVDLHGGELHIAHAWELYGEATMRHSSFMHIPSAEVDDLLDEEGAKHGEALAALIASARVPKAGRRVHLVKGAPAQVIPALVARLRINLLVLGTVARTGVTAMVMGNTAERVVDEVNCSVIAVKPGGFVSSVKPGQ